LFNQAIILLNIISTPFKPVYCTDDEFLIGIDELETQCGLCQRAAIAGHWLPAAVRQIHLELR
jgi:hypothetical protein